MRLWRERDLLSATTRLPAPARSGAPLVLAAAVLWGTSGASQAMLGGAVSPLFVGASRIIIGGSLLAVITLFIVGVDAIPRAAIRAARAPVLLAGVCIATYQITFFSGVRMLGIAVGTILTMASAPFVASAISFALGEGRPSRTWLATISLAVVGLVLLLQPEDGVSVSLLGVLAALGAGLSFGSYAVLAKRLVARGIGYLETVALSMAAAAVLLVPFLVLGVLRSEDPAAVLRPPGLLVLLWLAVAATALGYLLFAAGLRMVTAVTGSTLTLAEPLTAALLGVLVFAERLGPTARVGAALVAAALLITSVRPDIRPAR